jgi:hypothetical protein
MTTKVRSIEKNADSEEYATRGPFSSIFGGPIARLFDQALIVGNAEQTISILSESTNLSYKTIKEALHKMVEMGFVIPTRKIGNAQAYKFHVENHMSSLLACGAKIQRERQDL